MEITEARNKENRGKGKDDENAGNYSSVMNLLSDFSSIEKAAFEGVTCQRYRQEPASQP